MNLTSVRSRFLGSYVFLIILFVIQLPIIYVLLSGMSKKYPQVEVAGSLRKRAVEITSILNRRILNGEAELEAVFQTKRDEYGKVIEGFRAGTKEFPPVTDRETLLRLDDVAQKWNEMNVLLGHAMTNGDKLVTVTKEIEDSTFPTVEKFNGIVKAFVALNDKSYGKSIDLAGLQRMRTVKMAYLVERYTRSNHDTEAVGKAIIATAVDFEATLNGLRYGSAELGLKAVTDRAIIEKLQEVEGVWLVRKGLINEAMLAKDNFHNLMSMLTNTHYPAVISASDEFIKAIAAAARGSANTGLKTMGITVLVSIALAGFFIWSSNTHIIKPIISAKETVEGFARGDLSKRAGIKVRFLGREMKDEIAALGTSVDEMASQMSKVIGAIADSSGQLASASEQLAASSTQMSDGAGKQSGQATQVATAMEEMNATVVEVAKNSQQVSESSRGAEEMASKGGEVVKQAILAMKEVAESTSLTADTIKRLGKSSEKIGAIVSVIDDIADQTNLLALNAAIEAARAGDQGRGFAVVADEVRKLAERTTKATKEISGMIKSIQDETNMAVDAMAEGTVKVEKGVKLANEAGDSLGKIVVGVQKVSQMISQIAGSTEQQSTTADEISRSMESIAGVSKTNVDAIGEVSRTTNEMARLASELQALVARFKIIRETDAAAALGQAVEMPLQAQIRRFEPAPARLKAV
ncbi:MAG: methyl-accepting chemotaxis protein [Deltaproteobacteria bacterium]|nr:methyl-accepting chemotaxis protein [Deltaproteobacteria bacterium]